jgi:hypothetical protein
MITKEEFEKAVEFCTNADENCAHCPLSKKFFTCGRYLTRYIKENEPAPVIKNTPSAECNTNTIYENAKITDVSLGIGDHCCLTFSITLKGSGWGASFGGYNLAFFNGTSFEGSEKGLEALTRIMDVVGVAKWEDIKSHYVRVKQENRLVVGIGNIIADKWFEPREFFKEIENE